MSPDPLLSLRGLQIGSPGGETLVHDLGFDIAPGEVLSFVGESGSGKTLAARAILRLLPPALRVRADSLRFAGTDILTASEADMRRLRGQKIGMVFQEPMTSLNPAVRIGVQLTEALRVHRGLSRSQAEAAAVSMLERIGIDRARDKLDAYPHAFSGGMRQRIMIASVMLLRPALVIADEPTTALDSITQREVLDLLRDLVAEAGAACLLISHDLPMVTAYADRVIVLQKGRVVEEGPSGTILRTPARPYTADLVAAIPTRTASTPSEGREVLLEVRGAKVTFGPRRRLTTAVDGADLDLRRGETLAVVGASGSGKTTLARAILGLTPLAGGSVRVFGQDCASLSRRAWRGLRGRLQFVYQDPYSSLDPRMSVEALIAEPLRHEPGLSPAGKAARVDELIADVGLTEVRHRRPDALSGGQRQRVAIARAIVRHPDIVVADEPVAALDATVQKQVLSLLARLKADYGFSILFISHDLGVVDAIADRIAVMQSGRIVEHGRKEDVIDRPAHPYTRRLIAVSYALGAREARHSHPERQIEEAGKNRFST